MGRKRKDRQWSPSREELIAAVHAARGFVAGPDAGGWINEANVRALVWWFDASVDAMDEALWAAAENAEVETPFMARLRALLQLGALHPQVYDRPE